VSYEEALPDARDEFGMRVRVSLRSLRTLCEMRHLLSPAGGFYAFQLWAHKGLRYLVFVPLIAALVANLMLAGRGHYLLLLALQVAFYGAAAVGLAAQGRPWAKALGIPAFFVIANAAAAWRSHDSCEATGRRCGSLGRGVARWPRLHRSKSPDAHPAHHRQRRALRGRGRAPGTLHGARPTRPSAGSRVDPGAGRRAEGDRGGGRGAGIDVRTVNMAAGPNPAGAWRLRRLAADVGADVVHTHGYKGDILFGFLPRPLRAAAAVATVHGYTEVSRWSGWPSTAGSTDRRCADSTASSWCTRAWPRGPRSGASATAGGR